MPRRFTSVTALATVALASLAPSPTAVAKEEPPPPADPETTWEPDAVPHDAPAACLDKVGRLGKAKLLARGPRRIGTYTLENNTALDTPKLRLKAYGEFIPERVGSNQGEVQARFEASFLPDVDRDGPNPENTVFTAAPGSLRIGPYRVTTRPRSVTATDAGNTTITYDAVVEELGCPESAVHPPLAPRESRTFWLSTEGVMDYTFSEGVWWDNTNKTTVRLSADLDPDVQQDDATRPHGWINFSGWERIDGPPTWQDTYAPEIKGFTVGEHQVEVLRILYGKDTSVEDGRVHTKGGPPVVSVLVRITRT